MFGEGFLDKQPKRRYFMNYKVERTKKPLTPRPYLDLLEHVRMVADLPQLHDGVHQSLCASFALKKHKPKCIKFFHKLKKMDETDRDIISVWKESNTREKACLSV